MTDQNTTVEQRGGRDRTAASPAPAGPPDGFAATVGNADPELALAFTKLLEDTAQRYRVVLSADWMTEKEIRLELDSDRLSRLELDSDRPAIPGEPAVGSAAVGASTAEGATEPPAAEPAADPDEMRAELREAQATANDAVLAAQATTEQAYRAVIHAQLLAAQLDELDGALKARRRQGSATRKAVRHRATLVHGVADEIRYLLTRKPRTVVKTLFFSLLSGLAYLVWIRLFNWDKYQAWTPFLGVLVISTVMGGSACVNAMAFDASRVRAALDRGMKVWQIIVIKNVSLALIVLPLGVVMSIALTVVSGRESALVAALFVVITLLFLWSGVGNVLSVTLPVRDVSIKKHREEHTLKQYLIAFAISWVIGYGVNALLIWRVLAAREMRERWNSTFLAGLYLAGGGMVFWILLTVVSVTILNQPEFRQRLRLQLLMSRQVQAEQEPAAG